MKFFGNFLALVAAGILLVTLPYVAGCAGTGVKQKSITRSVTPDGKIYISNEEITKGQAGAFAAKLDSGALQTYVEVGADGSYIVDLAGTAAGADSTAVPAMAMQLGIGIAALFAPPQLAVFNQAITDGASAEELAVLIMEAATTE